MNSNNKLGMNHDHVGGSFKWEIEPACCEMLKDSVAEQFVFVSNFTDEQFNQFYMMPLMANGELFRSDGLPIQHCPWCGEKIRARKLYESSKG